MAIDTISPRTRRAILMGAMGGAVAAAVATVGRASPVGAANGEPVVVGGQYTATSVTRFDTQGNGSWALSGKSDDAIGVVGQSVSGTGMYGKSDSGDGIYGQSKTHIGVEAQSQATGQPAIFGWTYGNSTGVQGYSGTAATPPAAPAKTGVFGYANQDATAVGIKGQSVLGTGGLFTAGAKGTSLRATGRVRFDNAAGVATVPPATNSITVAPGTDLSITSAVVATLQGIPSGTALVKSVAVNPTANTFTIYLTANATHATKVAWHVFG